MQVDVESTVGLDAFARIAPAIPTVADAITVHSQFEALTATTGGRLPFPIYDKYVSELDKWVSQQPIIWLYQISIYKCIINWSIVPEKSAGPTFEASKLNDAFEVVTCKGEFGREICQVVCDVR